MEIVSDNITQRPGLGLGDVGDPGPVEKVAESDFVDKAELELFMNELVKIKVHESGVEGALEVISPQVNGLNMPILRGQDTVLKRKYVEVLARCRTTTYVQKVMDASRPENIQMVERTVQTYPFALLEDSDKGKAWLSSINES